MTHTRYILTEHHDLDYIHQIWQVETPKVAFESDYVMHGLLGFAALHKAHMEPEGADRLRDRNRLQQRRRTQMQSLCLHGL